MNACYSFVLFNETEQLRRRNDVVVVCDVGDDIVLCCTNSEVGSCKIYIWQDAVDYYVFVGNIMNETPKIIDN